METLQQKFKRYAHSSLITFLSAFIVAFSQYLLTVDTIENFTIPLFISALLSAINAGVRAVLKFFVEFKKG